MDNYDDIINLPHYEPKHHPRMSMWNRAAQFAPFAALTGYDDAIKESGRLVENQTNMADDYNMYEESHF
ncbi:hypothetical protein [Prevotella communis]|uniref:hypothetical protein n=1 Tax=Prevotella communis TaxID=2913614 RepID=UPI001EDB0F9C|nr:hypothetical protein [Prevotella communis]UKK58097.1 hypothetical protein L6476_09010 [Prevotella communis]UKK63599.1 hypothetical protein L6468_09355 [Prevotella communis]UKK66423.1 hypothetical protein L6473_09360 [Prevotella communis]UKK69171.1 hypothetical protein L6464_06910 [Prevotella communis]UKK71912.1 hypothetical protein L6466_05570 [Prevotella communis]